MVRCGHARCVLPGWRFEARVMGYMALPGVPPTAAAMAAQIRTRASVLHPLRALCVARLMVCACVASPDQIWSRLPPSPRRDPSAVAHALPLHGYGARFARLDSRRGQRNADRESGVTQSCCPSERRSMYHDSNTAGEGGGEGDHGWTRRRWEKEESENKKEDDV